MNIIAIIFIAIIVIIISINRSAKRHVTGI